MIEIICSHCHGKGYVKKPVEKCTPYELATAAHKKALDLWNKHDEIKELSNLVAILFELKRKLNDS